MRNGRSLTKRQEGAIARRTKLSRTKRLKTRVQMKAVSKHHALVKQLDELARDICMVKLGAARLDGTRTWYGPCQRCQKFCPLHWAHFNSRRIHALRWDPDNATGLCAGCHYTFAHHKPAEFRDWWLERIGDVRFGKLAVRLKTARRPDLMGLKVALTEQWKALIS